jgi:hypothetical protein
MRKPLSRRMLLQGLGTAIALPMLDAMSPVNAAGKRKASQGPLRLAFVYVPNGAHLPDWRPATKGPLVTLPPILAPLQNVKEQVLVLSGLAQDNARGLGDGPGDHARALACFLTGVHPVKTDGANIRNGVSVDQLAAAQVGSATRLPSLELGAEAGAGAGSCDSGYSCAYTTNLSWKTEKMPLAKEVDPALVFDRLFGTGVDPKRDRQRQSILDFARQDVLSLKPKLGKTDQRKMDEYFTGVRELEQRIARFGALPPVSAPGFARPDGSPRDYQEHIRLMFDLMLLGFQSDITRITTFLVARGGSNHTYPNLGINEGHHELSHHGKSPDKLAKIARINRFHVEQLAYLLDKMKLIPEGDGTLLDNAMIVFGSGIGDGDRHNHDDLPVLLAGRGGGTIRSGRHVAYPHTPLNNLYLSLLDRMEVPVETFGDSTGRLVGLT